MKYSGMTILFCLIRWSLYCNGITDHSQSSSLCIQRILSIHEKTERNQEFCIRILDCTTQCDQCLVWSMSSVINVWCDQCPVWSMSYFTHGVINVWCDQCPVWSMSFFTHSLINVWCDQCLVWSMSGVINVWCDQCPISHTVWSMSGVINVWCDQCPFLHTVWSMSVWSMSYNQNIANWPNF